MAVVEGRESVEHAGVMPEGAGARWLLMLGLALSLALVVVVGVLVYDRLAGPLDPPPAVGLASSRVSARQAFVPAAESARHWQPDARLAAVSGQWSAVGEQPSGQVEWAFQFFSPSAQRLALVTVAGKEARVVREGASPHPVPTLSMDEWRVDSDKALWAWWNRVGKDLVAQHPDTHLAMQLRVPDEGGEQPVWTVVGLVAGAEDVQTVTVNATDGTVVGP